MGEDFEEWICTFYVAVSRMKYLAIQNLRHRIAEAYLTWNGSRQSYSAASYDLLKHCVRDVVRDK